MPTATEHSPEFTNHASRVLQLLSEDSPEVLSHYLNQMHGVELASLLQSMDDDSQTRLLRHVTGLGHLSALLSYADNNLRMRALDLLDEARIAAVVRRQEIDDAADILGSLPRRKQVAVLRKLSPRMVKDLTSLLAYEEQTAGGIMTPLFVTISEKNTVNEVLEKLRENLSNQAISPNTNISNLYVVDDGGHLLGVASLRELLTASPNTVIGNFATRTVITVFPEDDQEKVSRLIADYDLNTIPVVSSEDNTLLGIVTVDDIIDVIEEELTEDLLKLAGTEDQDKVTASVKTAFRSRLPWLIASWLGGTCGAMLLGGYSSTIEKMVALTFFMPVVFGMGGNVGSQSSTISVRGIATGALGQHNYMHRLRKEGAIGATLGITFGLLLGLVSFFLYRDIHLTLIVGCSIMATMTFAALLGSILPFIFTRLGFDPAVASGPFVTTSTDILSIIIYFSIASMFF